MYALLNVERFVRQDVPQLVGERAGEILDRAKSKAENGILSGGAIEEIMGDEILAQKFHNLVTTDPEHIRIGLAAIQAAHL